MPHAFDQSRYQVRFDWGMPGLERLAASDVVVLVDVLGGDIDRPEQIATHAAAHQPGALVLTASFRNADATAAAALAEQQRRAARTSIAVIACGDADPTSASERFAVEDLLGAGAVVDALGALGIDHTSPEAAAAGEAFRGLRGALRHLLTASGSGQQLIDQGRRDEVLAAAELDAEA